MYTATQAIEQTVKARITRLEYTHKFYECPLCEYESNMSYKYRRGKDCHYCPIVTLTGLYCSDMDFNYHNNDPEMGVSFALALQYYWDIYKKTGKKL
jgi:hypothetical protein